MTIFAVIEHGDHLLCLEIDETATTLLKPGKVVQQISTKPTIQMSGSTALVPVILPRNGRRKFRLKSIQQFQIKPSGSDLYGDKAGQFFAWIKRKDYRGEIRAIATFREFFAETQTGKFWTEVAYGSFHFGWRRGWWEINDASGSECALVIS
jgi:hypothetical protein